MHNMHDGGYGMIFAIRSDPYDGGNNSIFAQRRSVSDVNCGYTSPLANTTIYYNLFSASYFLILHTLSIYINIPFS